MFTQTSSSYCQFSVMATMSLFYVRRTKKKKKTFSKLPTQNTQPTLSTLSILITSMLRLRSVLSARFRANLKLPLTTSCNTISHTFSNEIAARKYSQVVAFSTTHCTRTGFSGAANSAESSVSIASWRCALTCTHSMNSYHTSSASQQGIISTTHTNASSHRLTGPTAAASSSVADNKESTHVDAAESASEFESDLETSTTTSTTRASVYDLSDGDLAEMGGPAAVAARLADAGSHPDAKKRRSDGSKHYAFQELMSAWSWLYAKLPQLGFLRPTRVQRTAIPLYLRRGLEQSDIVLQDTTGSGKTLAYLLPLLARINNREQTTQAIILVPTKELTVQVTDTLQSFLKGGSKKRRQHPITVLRLSGKASIAMKQKLTHHPPHVIVSTPQLLYRLAFIQPFRSISLAHLQTVVLDEADFMLNVKWQQAISFLISQIKKMSPEALVSLVSATMNTAVRKLAQSQLTNPVYVHLTKDISNPQLVVSSRAPAMPMAADAEVDVTSATTSTSTSTDRDEDDAPPEISDEEINADMPIHKPDEVGNAFAAHMLPRHIVHFALVVPDPEPNTAADGSISDMAEVDLVGHKAQYLPRLFAAFRPRTSLVFVNNHVYADPIVKFLSSKRIRSAHVTTNTSKQARIDAMRKLGKASINLIVCTDMLSRGVDVPGLSHVVNLQLPMNRDAYLHRGGRVGRVVREFLPVRSTKVITRSVARQRHIIEQLDRKKNAAQARTGTYKEKSQDCEQIPDDLPHIPIDATGYTIPPRSNVVITVVTESERPRLQELSSELNFQLHEVELHHGRPRPLED
jgi:superfamily II DNA/RNA helicase